MSLSRRHFLGGALAAGGAAAFGGQATLSSLARAAEASDRYFVLCYFGGGWDVLSGLDGRDPSIYRRDNRRDTGIEPAYDIIETTGLPPLNVPGLVHADGTPVENHFFGPAFGTSRLAPHLDKLAVVRGMSMDTLTHEAGRRRFLTGKVPSGLSARGSSASTWLASALGANDPIPNLSVNTEAYNVDRPVWATALGVANVNDLLAALRPGASVLGARERDLVEATLDSYAACQVQTESATFVKATESRHGARTLVNRRLDSIISSELTSRAVQYGHGGNYSSPEAYALLAVTAITLGLSRCVSITVTESLDTHYDDWFRVQTARQRRGFNTMATMIEDLGSRAHPSGGTWLDRVTFLGFSEFSRTAMLNASLGRDHHLMNGCVLAGGGIRGGVVAGASTNINGMLPGPVNLTTGVPDPNGVIMYPEHVVQSLLHLAGISSADGSEDPADLRVPVLPAILA